MAKSSDIKKLALGALALSAFTVPIFRSGGRTGLTFVGWVVNHTIFGSPVEYVPEEDYTRELEGVEIPKQLPSGSELEKAMAYYQISEPSARELLSHQMQLKISSPAIVIEDKSYLVRLTITNRSTRAGIPVEAVLGVGISAATEWVSLITTQVSGEYFLANETRIFEYTMNVPMGSGGQSGDIGAWVQDPTGVAIASSSEVITIESVALARFYMPVVMEVKVSEPYNGTKYYTVTFSLTITNKSNATGRYGIAWGSNYLQPWYEEEASRTITLAPGESHNWSWTYEEVFDYYRGYFTCWLFGEWEGDNESVGVWR